MPKPRSPANEAEFRALCDHMFHLSAFLAAEGQIDQAFADFCALAFHSDHPGVKKVSLTGLRQADNDLLEMTRDLPRQVVADADSYLRRHGAPTLTERRHQVWRTIPKILARGQIRNAVEYYLIKEWLIGTDGAPTGDSDRALAAGLLDAYEKAQIGRPNAG